MATKKKPAMDKVMAGIELSMRAEKAKAAKKALAKKAAAKPTAKKVPVKKPAVKKPAVSRTLIKAYTFTPRPLYSAGYFDAKKKTFKPFDFVDVYPTTTLEEVLGDLTNAVEAGLIDSEKWTQQLFATAQAFEGFLAELAGYDDCYRITDQWWTALAMLIGGGDEEGFITGQEIADLLREEATAYKD